MNINLELIKSRLLQLQTEIDCSIDYWVSDLRKPERDINLNPFDFFSERISKIDELSRLGKSLLPSKDWTKDAVVYNMLVRYTTAYDHDRNGIINISPNEYGLMETGTFLKTIALLPYLHELGVNTIHLLPITSIGFESHKGNLGSPYAIRNPYQLDDRLSEPFLEMSPEVQFGALVEAAHSLGMKVVLEFVFRTASLDSELALQHPEWFYWIKANIPDKSKSTTDEITYSAPIFTEEELEEIEIKIKGQDFEDLIPPPKEYIDMFTEIPEKIYFRDGRIMVETKDGTECRIPSAFATGPPMTHSLPGAMLPISACSSIPILITLLTIL